MKDDLLYLDSSAIVKLVLPEPESKALVKRLDSRPSVVSSALAQVEVTRAVNRTTSSLATAKRTARILEGIAFVRIDDRTLSDAAKLKSANLGSLDAIHLATAMSLGDRLDGFLTYDSFLANAARGAGLEVLTPVD